MSLTAPQQRAVHYLARGESHSAIARALKVSVTTVRKWHRLDGVQREIRRQRDGMLEELAGVALGRLRALMEPDMPANVQLKAALEVLDRAGFSARQAPDAESFTINIDLSERPSISNTIEEEQTIPGAQPKGLDSPEDSNTIEEE